MLGLRLKHRQGKLRRRTRYPATQFVVCSGRRIKWEGGRARVLRQKSGLPLTFRSMPLGSHHALFVCSNPSSTFSPWISYELCPVWHQQGSLLHLPESQPWLLSSSPSPSSSSSTILPYITIFHHPIACKVSFRRRRWRSCYTWSSMAWIIGKSWWKNRHGAKNYSSWLTFF